MSQLIGMHEAYRLAKSCGYVKDQVVRYATMAAIVERAYKKGLEQGYKKTEAYKKPHS